MIKVVIFHSYGDSGFPQDLKTITDKPFPQNRTGEIIDYLEGLPVSTGDMEKKCNALKQGEILRLNRYHFIFGNSPYNISCSIIEVDNSNPWTIKTYDGAESIVYLNIKELDSNMNYWSLY